MTGQTCAVNPWHTCMQEYLLMFKELFVKDFVLLVVTGEPVWMWDNGHTHTLAHTP